MRYYFKCSFLKTLIITFCLTLFFELTQLTGLYFIYPRPYRLFDVNDLFVNTVGGLVGWTIAPLLRSYCHQGQMDADSYAKGTRVTVTRRVFAWLIDWGIDVVSFIVVIAVRLLTQQTVRDFSGTIGTLLLKCCCTLCCWLTLPKDKRLEKTRTNQNHARRP